MAGSPTEDSAPIRSSAGMWIRCLGILALLIVLGGLIAASIYIRPNSVRERNRRSVLDDEAPLVSTSDTTDEILEKAESYIAQLRRKYPNSADPLAVEARMRSLTGSRDEAKDLLCKAFDTDPNNPELLWELGQLALETDRFEEALGYFEDLAVVTPADPRVSVSVGESLVKAGRVEEGALVLEQHVSTEAASIGAWIQLGQANLQLGRFARATPCFERVLQSEPDSKDAMYGLVRALAGSGEKERAAEVNKKFRSLAQKSREDNAAEAQAFSDHSYAVSVLTQVLWDSANVELRGGDVDSAEELLVEACRLSRDNSDYLKRLLELFQASGEVDSATSVAEELAELSPTGGNLVTLGGLYAAAGLHNEAIATFEKAREVTDDTELARQIDQVLSEYGVSQS